MERWTPPQGLLGDHWNISLIIPQVHPTELGSYCTEYLPTSDISGCRVFQIRIQVSPDPGCNLQDQEIGSVPLILLFCLSMDIPVSAEHITPHPNLQDLKWTTRPKNQKPQGPAHPLIRFFQPSSPLTVPTASFAEQPQTTTPPEAVALPQTFRKKGQGQRQQDSSSRCERQCLLHHHHHLVNQTPRRVRLLPLVLPRLHIPPSHHGGAASSSPSSPLPGSSGHSRAAFISLRCRCWSASFKLVQQPSTSPCRCLC